MPTIKDVAHLAGVSQGTVSNVLNGKGIVSSEKIKLVQKATIKLGYTGNERAKALRKGSSKLLALILPNLRFRQYVHFYSSFAKFAESNKYTVQLYISNNNPYTELEILPLIRSSMVAGVVTFSCLSADSTAYSDIGFAEEEVLFVEKDRNFNCNYIGFNYSDCGKALAQLILKKKMKRVTLVTENPEFSNEADFIEAFQAIIKQESNCKVNHQKINMGKPYDSAFNILGSNPPDAVCFSTYGYAKAIHDVWDSFYLGDITILTASPIFSMPEERYSKYELNYSQLGHLAAKTIRNNVKYKLAAKKTVLNNTGFRNWKNIQKNSGVKKLKLITFATPCASALQSLSKLYTLETGVDVEITILPYEELHGILASMENFNDYDILCLDVNWLSWGFPKLLIPLEEIDPTVTELLDNFVEGIGKKYSHVEDVLYALPFSPSSQLLFYRKDLFESTVLKRLYYETYKTNLLPPITFAEYNQISQFFSNNCTHNPIVKHGTTLTLGNPTMAAKEFLMRYFAKKDSLFASDGTALLTSKEALLAMQELLDVKDFVSKEYCHSWTNAAQQFAKGDVAMTILCSNFASNLVASDSKVINKIGYSLVPGTSQIIGGESLGISKNSKHPKQALDYIRWVNSEPLSTAITLFGGVPSCNASYENYEVVDKYPWLELVKESFSLSKCQQTPNLPKNYFNEIQFLDILGTAVLRVFNGEVSSEKALADAQKQYDSIARKTIKLI